ncbi:MAG: hypothetical protein RI894_559 [Bacteroidota bacterium]
MQKNSIFTTILIIIGLAATAQPPSSPFNKTKGAAPATPPPQGQAKSLQTDPVRGGTANGNNNTANNNTANNNTGNNNTSPKKDAISIYEKEFQERIKKTEINGVYIPKDLEDALNQLDKLISEESKAKFKTHSEDESVHKLYFSLGRWIWTNWSLLDGSRLSEFFREYGIHHPEDIATIIIRSYHRRLNGKELNLKQQMEDLKAKYAKEDAARKEKSIQKLEKEDGKNYLTKEEMEAKKKGH